MDIVTIRDFFGHTNPYTTYLYAVEIEMEYKSLGNLQIIQPMSGTWKFAVDGSLRGNSVEIVTKKPKPFDKIAFDIAHFYGNIEVILPDFKLVDTVRAGTHMHMNCNHLTLSKVFTFLAVWYALERAIIRKCGKGRLGNNFCVTAYDSYGIIDNINNFLLGQKKFINVFTTEDRYAALNLASLATFGTLEFRALRTMQKYEPMVQVLSLVCELFENTTKTFNYPFEVIEQFSANPNNILEVLIPNHYRALLDLPTFQEDFKDGVRLAQDFAFTLPSENAWFVKFGK